MEFVKLESEYKLESDKIKQLLGYSSIPESLIVVFNVTEAKWEENVQRLLDKDIRIKYLMIGEAAPSLTGETVNYFYNNCHGSWCKAIVDGIIPWHEQPYDLEDRFEEIAKRQFLLVDILPFAIDYSATKLRQKPGYVELIKLCAYSYFRKKLFDPRLKWEKEVKVAFGVKKTAEAMKAAFPNGYKLPNGQILQISSELAATTAANYPSAERVREIFET